MNVRTAVLILMIASHPPAVRADSPPHIHVHPSVEPPSSLPSTNSLYQVASRWTDQDGHRTALGEFKGQVLVMAMVYTSCQGACPLTVADLQAIQTGVPEAQRRNVRFVLVTMDPARDTPARLKEYARLHRLEAPEWTLLTGSADDVRELAAVLGVQFKQQPNGDFSHSNVISVLDAQGVVRHQQLGLRQPSDATVAALRALMVSTPANRP